MTQAKCCSNVAVLIIYLATCQKIILLMFEGFFFNNGVEEDNFKEYFNECGRCWGGVFRGGTGRWGVRAVKSWSSSSGCGEGRGSSHSSLCLAFLP